MADRALLAGLVGLLVLACGLAGCTAPAPSTDLTLGAGASQAAPEAVSLTEPQVEKVAWERALVPFVGVCANLTVRSGCVQEGLGPIFAVLPLKSKNATKADLALTWTPSSPLTRELDMAIVAAEACGVDCFDWRNATYLVNWTTGPSPLLIEAPLLTAPPGNHTLVVIRRAQLAPTSIPVRAWASTQQDFQLEGQVKGESP